MSLQITVALPRVSTAGSLRIRAFFLAIRCTPSAITMVAVAGRPSGMMEMAREMATRNCGIKGRWYRAPRRKIRTQTISPMTVRVLPTALSLRLMGVSSSS